MAIHYRDKHHGEGAHLKFELIRTENNTILRKIFKAYYIYSQKPEINNKSEVPFLHRVLVNGNVILINYLIYYDHPIISYVAIIFAQVLYISTLRISVLVVIYLRYDVFVIGTIYPLLFNRVLFCYIIYYYYSYFSAQDKF